MNRKANCMGPVFAYNLMEASGEHILFEKSKAVSMWLRNYRARQFFQLILSGFSFSRTSPKLL